MYNYLWCSLQFIFFFFFKQKTAYEMRISDWSSDVCSSDLRRPARPFSAPVARKRAAVPEREMPESDVPEQTCAEPAPLNGGALAQPIAADQVAAYLRRHPDFLARHPDLLDVLALPARDPGTGVRSEERRVGKECVSTGRAR